MVTEATQIPQIDAVQEPDNVPNHNPSPKHQITDPGVIFKRYVVASGAISQYSESSPLWQWLGRQGDSRIKTSFPSTASSNPHRSLMQSNYLMAVVILASPLRWNAPRPVTHNNYISACRGEDKKTKNPHRLLYSSSLSVTLSSVIFPSPGRSKSALLLWVLIWHIKDNSQ